jgi:hypothetical protein
VAAINAHHADFLAKLRHLFDTKLYDDKFDNWLFSPALFDLSRNPNMGHCLENVVVVQGVLLDIDHTDMTPDVIAHILSPYEVVIYSSFNHSPDDRSYCAVIPTSGAMTSDGSKAIRMMCVQKFRDHGFGDKGIEGPKHGVDPSTMHSAKLFFWPCVRPDGYFCHYREGGPAIDPRQWIETCPAAIIDRIIRPDRNDAPRSPSGAHSIEHRDQNVPSAIDYWRQHGCVQGAGRTQFWFLAKRLAEAGCDDREMRDILDEQAGHATNPVQRRGEIAGLLVDRNVLAARIAAQMINHLQSARRPIGLRRAGENWHSDMCYAARPPRATMLYALEVPNLDGLPLARPPLRPGMRCSRRSGIGSMGDTCHPFR